ncbi:MAG: phosphatidate cytidylyltransferase, partial [Bdellovibrionales bacterium]|nr:phosphatidate cytidylyltransferase [Bdellovibrionales bacterium]
YFLWLICVVIVNETSAYLGCQAVGGRMFSPRTSPNKTVSGAVVGVAGGTAGGILGGLALALPQNIVLIGCYALLAALLSSCGDLVESLMKRTYAVKDSSSLLPGHGGMLDRVDGFLFAVPLLFFM